MLKVLNFILIFSLLSWLYAMAPKSNAEFNNCLSVYSTLSDPEKCLKGNDWVSLFITDYARHLKALWDKSEAARRGVNAEVLRDFGIYFYKGKIYENSAYEDRIIFEFPPSLFDKMPPKETLPEIGQPIAQDTFSNHLEESWILWRAIDLQKFPPTKIMVYSKRPEDWEKVRESFKSSGIPVEPFKPSSIKKDSFYHSRSVHALPNITSLGILCTHEEYEFLLTFFKKIPLIRSVIFAFFNSTNALFKMPLPPAVPEINPGLAAA